MINVVLPYNIPYIVVLVIPGLFMKKKNMLPKCQTIYFIRNWINWRASCRIFSRFFMFYSFLAGHLYLAAFVSVLLFYRPVQRSVIAPSSFHDRPVFSWRRQRSESKVARSSRRQSPSIDGVKIQVSIQMLFMDLLFKFQYFISLPL